MADHACAFFSRTPSKHAPCLSVHVSFGAVGPSQSNNCLLFPFHPLFNNTKKIKQSMNLIDEMEARNEKAGNII